MVKILYNNKIVKKQYTNGNVINKIPFQVGQPITIKSPEYIERTASANGYIGLGEYFTSDTVIEIDFQMTQAEGFSVVGDYFNNDNDDVRFMLGAYLTQNQIVMYDILTSRIQSNLTSNYLRYHWEFGNYYIKDLDNDTMIVTGTTKTIGTRPNQLYLFHLEGLNNTSAGSQQNIDYGKVYSLKIKKNNVLVKDFIPYTDMNGNYGLYDKVSNTIFSSTGQMTGSSTINDVVIGSSSDTLYWQYADMGTPTPPLPYDAEVQYLESDGASYINTGAYLNTSNFEIGYEQVGVGTEKHWGYAHQGVASGAWVSVMHDIACFGQITNNVTISPYLTSGNNILKYTQSGITVNGTTLSKNLSLSGIDNLNTFAVPIFGWYDFYSRGMEYSQNYQLKSFYIKNNDVLVVDMIPVRKNGVGYMYDRVSGQLFGNAGTGSFIIGPDAV